MPTMITQETIETHLKTLKPLLEKGGKNIEIMSCEPPHVVIKLSGFCHDCGCSSSYEEGIKELIFNQCPEIESVEFV